MLSFENDYAEGAHEQVLRRLMETNLEQQPGYGEDAYCQSAKEKIRAACQCPQADIYFLVGGTQTNLAAIDGLLGPCQGVVSAQTGHINQHEAGAIEYTGHKVLPLPAHDGKLDARELRAFLEGFYADPSHAHMVWPGMAYISHPTEYGTLYTREELFALSQVCRRYQLPLYLDGARLGYGLMSPHTSVTLPVIAAACDAFSIGGTKVGALCGEALVFPRGNAPCRFFTQIKQHGALLAKGRLLGVQFDALFTDSLYLKISRHAIQMAQQLKQGLQARGFSFYLDSPTNQQFIVLENEQMRLLAKQARFSFWEKVDDAHSVVRLAVSWATQPEDVDTLLDILDAIRQTARPREKK